MPAPVAGLLRFFDEPLFKVHDVYSLEESPIFNVGLEFSEGSRVKPLV
jgi:hypothetical protein